MTWSAPCATPAIAWPPEAAAPPDAGGLWLLSGGVLFLQGSLSHHTQLLPKLAKEARAWLNAAEASKLGVVEGESLELVGTSGLLVLPAAIDDGVPADSIFVPYAYEAIELNRLGAPQAQGMRVRAHKAAAAMAGV